MKDLLFRLVSKLWTRFGWKGSGLFVAGAATGIAVTVYSLHSGWWTSYLVQSILNDKYAEAIRESKTALEAADSQSSVVPGLLTLMPESRNLVWMMTMEDFLLQEAHLEKIADPRFQKLRHASGRFLHRPERKYRAFEWHVGVTSSYKLSAFAFIQRGNETVELLPRQVEAGQHEVAFRVSEITPDDLLLLAVVIKCDDERLPLEDIRRILLSHARPLRN